MTQRHTIMIEGLDENIFSKAEISSIERSGAYLLSVSINLGYHMKIHVAKPNDEEKHFMFNKFDVLIAEEHDHRFKKPFLLIGDSRNFSKTLDDQELSDLINGSLLGDDSVGEEFKAIFQKYQSAKELHKELSSKLATNKTKSRAMKV